MSQPPVQSSSALAPSVSPQNSATPLIPPPSTDVADNATSADASDPKTGKRRLFGFGRKKDDKQEKSPPPAAMPILPLQSPAQAAPSSASRPISPGSSAMAELRPHGQGIPLSPSRLRSSSPRLHSPASSEIFERNVQEPAAITTLQSELSPAHIPSHVMTEDHIPPALEASVEAITSGKLDPDEVEIVTSAVHQPAAAGVLESTSTSHADISALNTPLQRLRSEEASDVQHSGTLAPLDDGDGTSTYGSLDPNDVRRLSFISFADVVQSEHVLPPTLGGAEPSSRHSSLPSNTIGVGSIDGRARSPLRSPRSPQSSTHSPSLSTSGAGVTTPPRFPPLSSTGLGSLQHEQSPARSAGLAHHSELSIETMSQAVRKTASGDLGIHRATGGSVAMSPVSLTDDSAPGR